MQGIHIFAQTDRNSRTASARCEDAFNAWMAEQVDGVRILSLHTAMAAQADWCEFTLTVLYEEPDEPALRESKKQGKCNTCGASLDQPSVLCPECWTDAIRQATR